MKFSLSVAAVVAMASSVAHAQVAMWGQCGGNGYSGSTTCVSGATCSKLNDWYSQCIPGTATSSTTRTTTSTTSTTTPPTQTSTTPVPTSTTTSGPTPNGTPGGVCPTLGSSLTLTANSYLPDPFTFFGGQKVTTKADWECRAKEISELFQRYELGTFPPKPSSVTGSYSGGKLTVNVSEAGKSISFTVNISGNTGSNVPAIIAYGAASIPIPSGVATITFNNDDIAAQANTGSRGSGKFYTLYGSGHTASALTAWAWGVDRIIDALEATTGHNINVKRVGVTGCSRNGKGAIVAGALVKRIALTIPQESGSGGSACWRLSDYQKSQGTNVQTAQQIITENVWFSKEFEKYVTQVSRLPFDHHLLAGLVAPRGLYIAENTDMEWLGSISSYHCPLVGRKIYEALGVPDNMGVSQIGGHNHCSFPSGQNSEITAFINKFLKDQSSNTNVVRTDGRFTFPESQFVNWSVPKLT